MSALSLFAYVCASHKARLAPLLHEEEVRAWAQDAVHYAWDLFGAPPDLDLPYLLINGVDETSSCIRRRKGYVIKISPLLEMQERRCATVGHECYHRVTMTREGLCEKVWVDEMMAFLFSEWFLERQQYPYHVGRVSERYVKQREAVDMELLRDFQRTGEYVQAWREQPAYPPGFMSGVARVGLALNHLAGREAMCRIIAVEDWESWIKTLQANIRYAVGSILGLTTDGIILPRVARIQKGYGFALKAVGRHAEAIEQYEEALRWQPTDGRAYYQLGFSLRSAGREEDARRAWEQAACYDPGNPAPAQNVASVYYGQKDYDHAIKWLTEAVRRDPTCVRAFYWLGKACLAIGDEEKARRAWARVVVLGDDAHIEEVRRFLNDGQIAVA